MKMTVTQLRELNPCEDVLDFVRSCRSLAVAWEKCERADWMIWLLSRLKKIPKEVSITFARYCSDSANNHAAYAARVAAYYAADTANTYAARAAAGYAANAAAANAADANERKKQANFLRTLMPNPFKA
jgi:hypothetical protein